MATAVGRPENGMPFGTAAQTAQRGPEHLFGLAACRADGTERQLQRGVNVWIVEMVKLERGRQLCAAEDQHLRPVRGQERRHRRNALLLKS